MRITIKIDGVEVPGTASQTSTAPETAAVAALEAAPTATAAGAIDGGHAPTAGSTAGIPPIPGVPTTPDVASVLPPAEAQVGQTALSAGPAPGTQAPVDTTVIEEGDPGD